ncbi:hypothetical protein GW17_00062473 [Ensete ventricosum]|nr:hypothetical protein GW17_00062473 [Ensete ventricosum]
MCRNLPPRHRGSRCHLHAPDTPLHVITNNHRIILFSKGCPNLSFPLCIVATVAQATAALAKGRPPLRLASPPLLATGLAAGDSPLRAPCNRPPLWVPRCKRLPPLRVGRSRPCPRVALLATGVAPCGRRWPPFRAGPGYS